MKPLYVVTCVSNPVRYQSRHRLAEQFVKHMNDSPNVRLVMIEQAFGDRPHRHSAHLQVRTYHELWHKENMLNLAIQALPEDWEYVAWIDADISFARPDWAAETVHQLQHYMFLQLFSHAVDLTTRHEPSKTQTGFVHDWYHDPNMVIKGRYAQRSHPGYAWAARREALDAVGGLIDFGILGSGDRHMACALIGKAEASYNEGVHPNYAADVLAWQARAEKRIRRDIGYVPGTILHHYHGPKVRRGYHDRWQVLVDQQFDPRADIYRDAQGLWQLEDDRIELRDAVRRYFRSRHEDDNSDHCDKVIA